MSPRLPRMTASDLVALLEIHGFALVRQKGSHLVMQNASGKTAIIPMHSGKILGPGILKTILKNAGIPEEEVRR